MVPLRVVVELTAGGETKQIVCTFDLLRPFPSDALDAHAISISDPATNQGLASEQLFDVSCIGATMDGDTVKHESLGRDVKVWAISEVFTQREVRGKGHGTRLSKTGSSSVAPVPASPDASPSSSSRPATDAPTSP